jgi:hypothetical protein
MTLLKKIQGIETYENDMGSSEKLFNIGIIERVHYL